MVNQVRPYIVALVAKNGRLDDLMIKQLIGMQEDLHNGIGRRRKKASIGIHNLDLINFPVFYSIVENDDFCFIPIDKTSNDTIRQILDKSESGKKYGHIINQGHKYPLILDTKENVISFPPIINGLLTKIDKQTRNLFVEVTASSQRIANDTLAIVAITLHDMGFEVQTVSIRYNGDSDKNIITPKMDPRRIDIEIDYINKMIGLDLGATEIIKCLEKARFQAWAKEDNGKIICCMVPRYRIDVLNPIDVVEEVLIGYGIYNLTPNLVPTTLVGQQNSLSFSFNVIRQTLIGMGLLEILNFDLISRKIHNMALLTTETENNDYNKNNILTVEETKSIEHEILRPSLIPSLLHCLSHNVHEEYPQRLFEIGKVFRSKNNHGINEYWCTGVILAHNGANFTEIKAAAQTLLAASFGKVISTKPITNSAFINGRCGAILLDDKPIGIMGEISPMVIENFRIRMPVSTFEINFSKILGL
jgi:phenylalanyl-tRNA synthetase beta chain